MAERQASSAAFGRAVRTYRLSRGLTQEQAGLQGGVARAFFGRVERGLQNPSYDTLIKVSEGLDVPPQDLVALAERFRRGELPADYDGEP